MFYEPAILNMTFCRTILFVSSFWNHAYVYIVWDRDRHVYFLNPFTTEADISYHISYIICSANQWTGFYMITASVIKELTFIFLFSLIVYSVRGLKPLIHGQTNLIKLIWHIFWIKHCRIKFDVYTITSRKSN